MSEHQMPARIWAAEGFAQTGYWSTKKEPNDESYIRADIADRMAESMLASIDMIDGCHDAPKNPDSLPQMVKVHLQQALSAFRSATQDTMSKLPNGGPAFPHDKYMKHGGQWGTYAHGGMSLRDYFAAAALAGLGTWTPNPKTEDGDDPSKTDRESVVIRRARWAYAQADAMIEARAAATGDNHE